MKKQNGSETGRCQGSRARIFILFLILAASTFFLASCAPLLLTTAQKPERKSEEEISTIHDAITRKDYDQVAQFIARGADVNREDDEGNTPLRLAVETGSLQMVKMLLDKGADVRSENESGWTPLHVIASINRRMTEEETEIAGLVIENGADVDATDSQDKTPLHIAASMHHFRLVEMLLDHGANVNARENVFESTPLHNAAVGTVYYDEQTGPRHKSFPDMVSMLLDRGADIDARDKYGNTPLHQAAMYLQIFTCEMLVSRGADINAKNDFGNTPLHLAVAGWSVVDLDQKIVRFCDSETASLLMARGADTHIKNNDGKVPLQMIDFECNELRMPEPVRQKLQELKKLNTLELVSNLHLGMPREDVLKVIGPMHDFKNKGAFINGKVMHVSVWTYWDGTDVYRLYFEIDEPSDILLNIAGFGEQSAQVQIPAGGQMEGGRLVQYRKGGNTVPIGALSLDKRETGLKFFESGPGVPPAEERSYGGTFESAEARYINWELRLKHLDWSRRADFVIHAAYYSPDGSEFHHQTMHGFTDVGWKSSMHAYGTGWEEPGHWKPGTYSVEILIAGERIAKGSFEIR
jgi:ankyrin repeat protein